jgi:putative transposase
VSRLSRAESPLVEENKRLVVAVKTIRRESRETYGSPRVYSAMQRKGISCGKHRVARLMRDHKICSRHKRKFKMTTDSNHRYPVAENILDRKFFPHV